MPPIPIYSDAPIKPPAAAAKAEGVTPQTAAANGHQQPAPTRTTATTTAAFDPSAPPPPQPGAAPVPPPTSQFSASSSPPRPQPGAAPVPAPTGSSNNDSTVTKTVTETVTTLGGPPPQFGIPAPGANAAATRSTDAGIPQHSANNGPTTINFGAVEGGATRARGSSTASLEHPPGYVQNPYVDGTAAQRAAMEDAAAREREEGGMWGTVKGFAASVGQQLKKADQEAWKLVGNAGK
ncbi:uncharacterized protein LTHEOB_12682 [Lasiodiplodia theobromae]|uniref:uncharacterized protein n=1 Tax=Lasiodiplodia theobromae TaxID=45133 RepID=UPI0015C3B372|nr:uncharacterized protein LTHEOB_12682 [Lasiodiplodia theobromae]KAF4535250.1 hypothetical protein LTHEOB_12682 [Lasiodiplodia theobromae]